jgi:hypothetical protein
MADVEGLGQDGNPCRSGGRRKPLREIGQARPGTSADSGPAEPLLISVGRVDQKPFVSKAHPHGLKHRRQMDAGIRGPATIAFLDNSAGSAMWWPLVQGRAGAATMPPALAVI